jgi:hypothetical protein
MVAVISLSGASVGLLKGIPDIWKSSVSTKIAASIIYIWHAIQDIAVNTYVLEIEL